MPIFDSIQDAVSNENFKMGAGFPAARLQTQTMDFDRQRTQMGDNSIERQNGQLNDYHLMKSKLMKSLIEPDIETAGAYKDIRTGISETSQGYHWANQSSQISGAVANNLNSLTSTVQNLQVTMNQLISLVAGNKA